MTRSKRSPTSPSSFPDFLGASGPPPDDSNPVAVARVGRSHGVRGRFHARGVSPNAGETLWTVDRVWLRPPGDLEASDDRPWFPAAITSRQGGTPPQLTLDKVTGVAQAKALVHWEIWVLREDFPAIDEDADEFYTVDLIGLTVMEPDGTELGRVTEVWMGPEHDNLVLPGDDGEELQIPFVEAHVAEVDLARGVIILTGRPVRAST